MHNDYTPCGNPRALTEIRAKYESPYSDLLRCVMLIGGSVMRGDESDVRGGGDRTWSPKRHFFFLISFPETNLDRRHKECLVLVPEHITSPYVCEVFFHYSPLRLVENIKLCNTMYLFSRWKSRLKNWSDCVINLYIIRADFAWRISLGFFWSAIFFAFKIQWKSTYSNYTTRLAIMI